MKGNKGRTRGKKALSLMLAVTLSMSSLASMGTVEAMEAKNANVLSASEETEITNMLNICEVTGDLSVVAESGEMVEDKEYVVYIEVSDEAQSVASEGNVISENPDADIYSVSENAVSKNTIHESQGKPDKETEQSIPSDEPTKTAEDIQESIEEAEELILKQADGQEVVKDEEAIIYAADLTQKEIETLEESDANIYVEENIELFGAKSKSDKKEKEKSDQLSHKSGDNQSEHKKSDNKIKDDAEEKQQESSDIKEKKLAYKKALSEVQEEEPEWNIRMVNADEIADGNEKTDIDETVTGEAVYNAVEEGTSHPVKIAVMDSGIELLSGIPVQEIVNLVPDEQDLPYYMNDMTGHGTAVAGIINDIAPNAEIYSVKIMDAENKATLTRVVEGIYWCIENDINIINMSFGTQTESQVLKKAIEDAHKAGILIVSSAGNGGTEGVEYPAAYGEVIAVGAVGTTAQKTEESAVGEEVELVAPGEEIISDSMLGLETVVSGTSMAAPHVTAAAAVLWQKDKTKSPDFIRGLLSQAANDLGDAKEYGNGLVDLEYALEQYEEYAFGYEEPEKAKKMIIKQDKIETTTAQTEEEMTTVQTEKTITVASGTQLTEEMLIEENETTVETYEEVDYVEGRWRERGHENLVNNANDEYEYELSADEINFFKLGAVYPDKVFKVKDDPDGHKGNKNWHGGYGVNYIANYRFVTGMAKYLGDVSRCKKIKGQQDIWRTQIAAQVNSKAVGGKTYETIFAENSKALGKVYNNASDSQKKKLRKCFLYGMAAHILTDTFCHSAFCRCGASGTYIKVSNAHKDAEGNSMDDDISVHPTRYEDAQEGMAMVIGCYQANIMGSEIDFSPRYEDWGKKRGYCLGNVLKYATDAAVDCTPSELEEAYKAINYVLP